jgi:hypothetical protein
VHPRDAEGFEWDEHNEGELAAHHIRSWEVEEVFMNSPNWAPNRADASGDWKMVGLTDGGRPMTVVVAVNERTRWLRAITGWSPPTSGERTKYLAKS